MQTEITLHKNIRLTGRVQGVGFRYSAKSIASYSNIKGFVRNLPNGELYIEAEGNLSQLEDFISWCRQGPPLAHVKLIDIYDGDVVGFKEFEIR